MKKTYLWYDYETFGADPKRDRISQFAGVRTDENFQVIDEMVYYCKLAEDYLPNPEASIITGITPQEAIEKGITENELAEILFKEFTKNGTVTIGYNSIKFDDEVTRNFFYRTFRDPYEREWKNNCSRWDLMRAILGVYVMKPELLNWPVKDDGRESFRLEELSIENGIIHENAHDAKSDVYATIGLAELINKKSPSVFNYFFSLKDKEFVKSELSKDELFLHIDFGYGYDRGYASLVYKMGDFIKSGDKNAFLFIDVFSDVDALENMSLDEIKEYLYYSTEKLNEIEKERPGLKQIRINQSPLIIPYKSLREKPGFLENMAENLQEKLEKIKLLSSKRKNEFLKVFMREEDDVETDADLDIYGSFATPRDRREMESFHRENYEYVPKFKDKKYRELYFRFIGRNMPEIFTVDEMSKWKEHCYQCISEEREGFQNMASLKNEISKLEKKYRGEREKLGILKEIKEYAENLEKKLKTESIKPGEQLKMF
ncbi:exodeoxyribonuclease I [uncultured Ilyobacter sp.]|uniref:exodeoxyribonuclease I n=1 Tax=uncultured Ilyobacter sp. TaxID=544433 RepID=UPI0029BFD9CC|nr:exodeoxyribonuclease I [uncultured Ilyobacter sp.]